MKVEASFHQERLWFIDRFETGYVYETNPVYHNIPLVLEIKGDIDFSLLEYGIREAARRHQALRTRIETVANRPIQVIENKTMVKLERLDLSNDPGQGALEAALAYAAKPMPLDGESLIRALLIRQAEQYYFLCIVVHHIICDRYSLSLLARETLDIYRAAAAGSTPALPDIPFHYADFSQWQRQMPADVSGPLLSYWKEKLRGGVEVLELPMDIPRPSIQVFHAARRNFEIPPAVFVKVLTMAQQQGCKPAVLLAAVFQALLHKYTGQEEIVMGTSSANRDREGLEPVIGPIANLLVVRSFIRADADFLTILSGVQKNLDEVYRYGAMPLDRLAAEIDPPKDMSRTVFFDVLFQYEESALELGDFPGGGIESINVVETNLGWGKYDLNLLLRGAAGVLVYNGDYYSVDAVDRLVGHYTLLLERLMADPHRPVAEMPVLSEAELHQLLYKFNDSAAAVPYPRDKTIHRLFEEQAQRTPDRIAVFSHGRTQTNTGNNMSITYCQLNEQSDRLAGLLKEKSAVSCDIIAIIMERSIELVAGVFGILKAGCAYLPILPDYPGGGIDYILKDSGAKLLVNEKFFGGFRAPRRGGPFKVFQKSPPGNSNLAYIIYTSGSTGRSKGVLVEHVSVVNLLFALFEAYPFSQGDCFLFKTTCMFDVSVSELFGWFLGGGRLAVLEPGGEKEPHKIAWMVENSLVTHIDFVPSVFNAFLDSLNPRDLDALKSLRYIFLAGEALMLSLVERFNRLPLGRSILLENLYGPTENTVYASMYSLSEWRGSGLVPIGKPLQNVELYILDKYGHLQPMGIPGELCISGAGIAVGYLNRPELTSEKFINKNFSGGPGGRFFKKAPLVAYRTGDLARWLPDGNVEFLGRVDHQIKVHGFRIEPGEIQHRLLELPYIKDCVIIDRPDAGGDKYLCAYVVCSGDKAPGKDLDTREIKDHLSRKLPGYMIPAHFVQLDAIPLNPNGKIDRRALPAPEIKAGEGYLPPADETGKKIAALWAEALSIAPDVIGRDTNFFDIGGNSLKINQVAAGIMEHFGIDLPGVVMFEYPTVASLSYHLTRMMGPGMPDPGLEGAAAKLPGKLLGGGDIAVIGMAGRFSDAANIGEFWENIKNGHECIAHFTTEELTGAGIAVETVWDPNYVKSYGVLKGKEYFDAAFFGFTPGDADLMDPQMRIFHECCWEALENAGYDPEKYEGLIGVYAGGGHNLDWEIQFRLSGKNDATGEWAADSLNNIDYLSTRIAYSMNLRGPAVTIQTACSTSLVAIHTACRALVNRDCDMALAGGIEISMAAKAGYFYQEGMINSPDGHCRAFDVEARGTVPGDGAGVTLLKPLADALAAGDTVRAVVKGSAVNNDGKLKVGFTAPGVNGQKTVIRAALLSAGVDPTTIGYVETHGTGTLLGDPIEIEALKQAFGTGKRGYCAVGSVKTNVGHTGAAAGAAGFIKTVFMLENHLIPASLHFTAPNPAIDFENSPFYVNIQLKEWKCEEYQRRAGVSSFGIGGTNAHVILEEYKQGALFEKTAPCAPTKTFNYLILLSAKTQSALEQQTRNLVEYFKKNPGVNLADAAYTLQVGRRPFKYRRMAVCSEPTGAVFSDGGAETQDRPVIFMFPGQGSQYTNMAIDLYKREPVFRQEIDRCFEILKPLIGYDLKEILYPFLEEYRSNKSNRTTIPEMINQTEITQPVIFIIEYALAKLIMTWGIKPWAMIGHSIGEYTAAHLAGVFSLEDALKIAASRGKAMQQMPPGEMLGVPLPEKELSLLLTEFGELSLAAVNGTRDSVVSGPPEAVDRFAHRLLEKDCKSRPLHTSHAFHSQMMDPMLADFENIMKRVSLHKPRIPYLSNVTGRWITPEEAVDPAYWVTHARNTVRFHDGLSELLKKAQKAVLVEVGPGRVLSTFARRNPDKTAGHSVATLLRHPDENIPDDKYLLSKIGGLWLNGQTIDWQAYHSGREKRRISLPTYPFERQPYRIAGQPLSTIDAKAVTGKARLIKKHDITDWFYAPAWKEMPLPQSERHLFPTPTAWLVFSREDDFCKMVKTELEKQGQQVVMVYRGHSFMKKNNGEFILNPRQEENYEVLFKELATRETPPRRILHLWQLTPVKNRPLDIDTVEEYLYTGFYSLLNIARALGKVNTGDLSPTQIDVVANHMQEVTGDELLCPAKAAILGPVKVIPQEYPHLRCRCIDIVFPDGQEEPMLSRLLTELAYEIPDPTAVVTYRHRHRWVQGFEPIRLPEPPGPSPRLKEKGVYLITGGLGGIGLTLARFLAQTARARLVLTGRSGFPAPEEWNRWLETHPADDKVSDRIRKIRELEKYGAEVMAVGVDVSDMEQMKTLLEKTKERFGAINGVIHSAGLPDGRLIHLRTQEFTEKILAPKIKGTLVLDYLLQQQPLDFFVLCSSVDAILGGIGQAGYTAANCFLDAFASYKTLTGSPSTLTVSINWDAWQQVGMAAETVGRVENRQTFVSHLNPGAHITDIREQCRDAGRIPPDDPLKDAILPHEGVEVFSRILSDGLPRVVVSTVDLSYRLEREKDKEKPVGSSFTGPAHPRPELSTHYVAPKTKTQEVLAAIWQESLGIREIGVHDDIFELGADSLKALTVIARIHEKLNVEVSITEIFTSPTIAGLAGRIENAGKSSHVSITPVEKKEYYPLSSTQARLYLVQQMQNENVFYNLPFVYVVEGALDGTRLAKAFQVLIRRHESLRTSFHSVGEDPVQQIHEQVEFNIEYADIAPDAGDIPGLMKDFIRPFDLKKAPLMRAAVLRREEEKYLWLLDIHHIIIDAAGYAVLQKDLMKLYNNEELPPLEVHYKDFCTWQSEPNQAGKIQEHIQYWLNLFAGGDIPVLNMPTDYPRARKLQFKGDRFYFKLAAGETRAFKELVSQAGATLFTSLLTVLNVLLLKYTGQQDIIIGTPISGRPHADLQDMVGMFVNMLPLRNHPDPEISYWELLKQVRTSTLEAFEHQDAPFEMLVKQLNLGGNLSRNPLFDICLNVQNYEQPVFEIKGLKINHYPYETPTAKFDMLLWANPVGDEIHLMLEYSTELFKSSTAEAFSSHFIEIIRQVIENKDTRLRDLRISHRLSIPESHVPQIDFEF
ncbi:MAG: amino acid adenylation domain-containing protein [Candidatus Aminicenantes bacterium]|nr:amino acid adenylation domain-containing protein [Candidatus Aminicenantes bacterium]